MLDLKITGGQVVDGTGAPARSADIGIKNGEIVALGEVTDAAAKTIDATGLLVTPGFVDIHTHYDGQVSWDADFAPSSLLGVTTAVMGSCGVGFAPCRESDRERLIELMEGVEDIPGTALSEGMTWGWQSFPEYLETIDTPHTIDFLAQVPHDALRVFVMGDRAAAGEPATEADIAAMQEAVKDALAAGAAGFSTGRTDNHRDAAGKETPSASSDQAELVGIAEAFKGHKHGVLQAVSDFDMAIGKERFDPEFDLLIEMTRASGGHPLSISTMQRDQDADQWERIIQRVEQANDEGLTVRMQVAPRAIGVMLGLEATFHPFMGFPSYKTISQLSLAERVERMRDPEFKAQLLTEKNDPVSGDGSSIPPLADMLLAQLDLIAGRLFRLGEEPNYEPDPRESILAEAKMGGKSTLEALYDALLEEDGRALLYFPLYNYTPNDLSNVRTMLAHKYSLPGLSDGGAHVGTICDASFPVFLLTHWGRDRAEGRFPVEQLIKRQTMDTANFMGLDDRGVLEVGRRADLNLIDFKGLNLKPPRLVRDLPAGGQRFLQAAEGIRATIVKGVVIAENGKLTGERPGRLVRQGQ